ncbi:helix-turn-helix transcriptional regulator [Streptomyces sp. WMMC1477]|uniref:helix-turn-helix transcriptional regulator n=1 Tax=Streptomyces sp. WMMC1477 TaxID=3015155 RepID=UPI0022B6318C|nr:LuxR C-terminal-related transcriptional regulator [Streptomyces sp. WMMC1477]MCZ7431436.1 LuxR C-terminal-related transcriptional regulator [Streptomyces sp. WMMC1477]
MTAIDFAQYPTSRTGHRPSRSPTACTVVAAAGPRPASPRTPPTAQAASVPAATVSAHPSAGFSTIQAVLSAARRDVVMIRSERAPLPGEIRQEAAALLTLVRRWVRVSVVWDEELLAQPRIAAYALWQDRSGVEVRTAAGVPVEVTLGDSRTAVVGGVRGGDLSVCHCPEIGSMLHFFFLGTWENAAPLAADHWVPAGEHAQDVLRLLAEGHTDESIAQLLNVSQRTVSRTVAKIMHELGARSRFEAGALATRLGWLCRQDLRA